MEGMPENGAPFATAIRSERVARGVAEAVHLLPGRHLLVIRERVHGVLDDATQLPEWARAYAGNKEAALFTGPKGVVIYIRPDCAAPTVAAVRAFANVFARAGMRATASADALETVAEAWAMTWLAHGHASTRLRFRTTLKRMRGARRQ